MLEKKKKYKILYQPYFIERRRAAQTIIDSNTCVQG